MVGVGGGGRGRHNLIFRAVKANRICQLTISDLKRRNFEQTDQIALIEKEFTKQLDEQSKIIENLIGENSRMLIEIYNLQNEKIF